MSLNTIYCILKALVFAQTALEKGYKFNRAVTNLQIALDTLMKNQPANNMRLIFKKIDREKSSLNMGIFDYYDELSNAIEGLKHTRFRYLNSLIGLASQVYIDKKE